MAVRLDPWQNIVEVGWAAAKYMVVTWHYDSNGTGNLSVRGGGRMSLPDRLLDDPWNKSWTWHQTDNTWITGPAPWYFGARTSIDEGQSMVQATRAHTGIAPGAPFRSSGADPSTAYDWGDDIEHIEQFMFTYCGRVYIKDENPTGFPTYTDGHVIAEEFFIYNLAQIRNTLGEENDLRTNKGRYNFTCQNGNGSTSESNPQQKHTGTVKVDFHPSSVKFGYKPGEDSGDYIVAYSDIAAKVEAVPIKTASISFSHNRYRYPTEPAGGFGDKSKSHLELDWDAGLENLSWRSTGNPDL